MKELNKKFKNLQLIITCADNVGLLKVFKFIYYIMVFRIEFSF